MNSSAYYIYIYIIGVYVHFICILNSNLRTCENNFYVRFIIVCFSTIQRFRIITIYYIILLYIVRIDGEYFLFNFVLIKSIKKKIKIKNAARPGDDIPVYQYGKLKGV